MTAALERRYRRLLALYPAGHRDEYGEEMLGVLLARAHPGQRRPSPVEAFDLARSALAARVGRFAGGLADGRWRDAAAVIGVVVPILFLALRLRFTVTNTGASLMVGQGVPLPDGPWFAWTGAWAAVVVAVACGLRRTAAVAAWLGTGVEAFLLGADYATDPSGTVYGSRMFVLALVAAAALSVPAPRRHGFALLGKVGLTLVLAGAAGFACAGLVDLTVLTTELAGGRAYVVYVGSGFEFDNTMIPAATGLVYLTSAALVAAALVRLERPLRRRVAVLLLPALAQYLLVRFTFGGYLASSPRFYPTPVLMIWPQWLALALTPVLAFVAGAAWVRRAERRDRLIRLGRERERELAEPAD